MVLLITYDLNKPEKDYSDLYRAIKAISSDYVHQLTSVWLMDTYLSAEQVFNRLSAHIDSNDELFVVRITKEYKGWLLQNTWDWLNKRVSF